MHLGFLLGWLRVPHQPDSPPRPGSDAHRPILTPHICGLLHSLLPGHHPLHANLFCWFPGKKKTVSFHHLTHPPSWTIFVNHTVSRFSSLSPFFHLPASAVIRAHGSLWRVWSVPDPCFCGLPAQQTQCSAI